MSGALEQQGLFAAESDEALFFEVDELRKRYTASQVKNIEWKRNALVMLVAAGFPTETIARDLGVSTRTVNTIAANEAGKVAGTRKDYAQVLLGVSARWIGLAVRKEESATFKDLVIGAGITAQRSMEASMTGEVEEEKVLEMAEDRSEVRDRVRERLARLGLADRVSGGLGVQVIEAQQTGKVDAGGGAGQVGNGTDGLAGGGGGSGTGPAEISSIGQAERRLFGKGPDVE